MNKCGFLTRQLTHNCRQIFWFTYQMVVEKKKILISIPKRFEVKILAVEKSSSWQTLTITELTSKLHAQEVSIGSDEVKESVSK